MPAQSRLCSPLLFAIAESANSESANLELAASKLNLPSTLNLCGLVIPCREPDLRLVRAGQPPAPQPVDNGANVGQAAVQPVPPNNGMDADAERAFAQLAARRDLDIISAVNENLFRAGQPSVASLLRAVDERLAATAKFYNEQSYLGVITGFFVRDDVHRTIELEELRRQLAAHSARADNSSLGELNGTTEDLLRRQGQALERKQSINFWSANIFKTMALFTGGRAGFVGTVSLNAIDQARPRESIGAQVADLSLGALKGGLLKSVMGIRSTGLAGRAVTLSIATRGLDVSLDRHNYIDPRDGSPDPINGAVKAVRTTLNPVSLGWDLATFGLAFGTMGVGNRLSSGLLSRRPLFANMFAGSAFGLASGGTGEVQRQIDAKESLDLRKIAQQAVIRGGVDALAAIPGGLHHEHRLRNTQFIVVGGGPHGVEHALQIAEKLGRDRVTIIDPHDNLLGQWEHMTGNTGMKYLRSPIGHYIGSQSLEQFAATSEGSRVARYLGPSRRPSLEMFNRHVHSQIERHGLDERHVRSRANALHVTANGVEVETDIGRVRGQYLVLAIGMGEQPLYPNFAERARQQGAQVNHIYDHSFNLSSVRPGERVAVVGGGITGAQTALALARNGDRVTLLTREPLKQNDLDFAPKWVTPEGEREFSSIPDYGRRRAILTAARNKGTIPGDVYVSVTEAMREGAISHRLGNVTDATVHADGSVRLSLNHGLQQYTVDRVILTTGFAPECPGGNVVQRLMSDLHLSVSLDGYPIPSQQLQWGHSRIFVSGPLAELEVGPPARNIIGAKMAARRIAPFLDRLAAERQQRTFTERLRELVTGTVPG